MPTLSENEAFWGQGGYRWERHGDEWSVAWGGPAQQWWFTLYPRIRRWLPAKRILELAPGHGRWSQFLRAHCEELVLVDMSAECIEACRARLGDGPGVRFHVNDGRSLAAVEDGSVDFAFSFDSLVHSDPEVVRGYVQELQRKLVPGGAGFIHHSHLGSRPIARTAVQHVLKRLPGRVRAGLSRRGLTPQFGGRDLHMTAELFAAACREAGLDCVGQELIDWVGVALAPCDCLSTFINRPPGQPPRVVQNLEFMAAAAQIRRLAPLYAPD